MRIRLAIESINILREFKMIRTLSFLLFATLSAFLISGCTRTVPTVGVADYTGFTELPFPSNVYQPGQIVEVDSDLREKPENLSFPGAAP